MVRTEIFQGNHFADNYKFHFPTGIAASFIDCFWESDFMTRDEQVSGQFLFRDRILPSLGSTIAVNLGNSFQMQLVGGKKITVDDNFVYSRHAPILSTHYVGNKVFGMRMINNILTEKLPVGGLVMKKNILPPLITAKLNAAHSFDERCEIMTGYVTEMVERNIRIKEIGKSIISAIRTLELMLDEKLSVKAIAKEVHCSTKTMERAFEKYVWATPKRCFRVIRFRCSINAYTSDPESFSVYEFGYFDHSHFYREVKEFSGFNLGNLKKPALELQA